jgi:hypothetical protein
VVPLSACGRGVRGEGTAMKLSKWKTPAKFFPWEHVQKYIDRFDPQDSPTGIALAQHRFGSGARVCPECRTPADKLLWCALVSPEKDWEVGSGKVGFITICKSCKLQVEFLVDDEATEIQDELWRANRGLN